MPDITMCANNECPLRSHCYRYLAVPDECWQSYSYFIPHKVLTLGGPRDRCDHLWDTFDEAGRPMRKVEDVDKSYPKIPISEFKDETESN